MSEHPPNEIAVLRRLFFGCVRQIISNTVIVYYDAASCYEYSAHNVSSLTDQEVDMPLLAIICCLKVMLEMKLYQMTYFGDSKCSYYRIIIHPFQILCQGKGGEKKGRFMISNIFILNLKEEVNEVKIKTEMTGYELKLVTMMFFNVEGFATLEKR